MNMNMKKTEYDELVKKVNTIDTSKRVNKTDYNAKIKGINDKIPIINLATSYYTNSCSTTKILAALEKSSRQQKNSCSTRKILAGLQKYPTVKQNKNSG